MAGNSTSNVVFALRADVERLRGDLARAKAAMNSYKATTQSIGAEISGYMTGMMSVGLVAAFGSAQFELIKRLDSTNKALQAVTGSSEEYNKAKTMLSETAEKYGSNLLDLTSIYTKFRAATKSSTLSTAELDAVFQKVAKATGVLGLNAEQTEGAFRALEQMFSKGNVQAEEIRGQLSERLPGAFNILAKSMGITTQELNKQLKLGNVLADEVLPKFADELLIAYGADKVTAIDSVTAAQQRFKNAWVETVQAVDSGSGAISEGIKGGFNALTSALKGDLGGVFTGFAKIGKNDPIGGFFYSLIDIVTDAGNAFDKKFGDKIRAGVDKWNKATNSSGLNDGASAAPVVTLKLLNEKLKELEDRRLETPAAGIAAIDKQIKALKITIEDFGRVLPKAIGDVKNKGMISLFSKEELKEQANYAKSYLDQQVQDWKDFKEKEAEILGQVNKTLQEKWLERAEIMKKNKELIQQQLEAMDSVVRDTIGNLLVSFAEALGTGDVRKFFTSFISIIGEGIVNMGKLLVQMGLMQLAFFNAPPQAKIAIGLAAIAIGSAFAKQGKSLSKAAGGGGSYGGRGGGYSGGSLDGQSIIIGGQFDIRGKDLELVYNKQQQINGRALANGR